MDKVTVKADASQVRAESRAALDELIREGARRMLQEALENEVAEYLARMSSVRTQDGRQAIVRNGFLPARELMTGVGPVRIRQGRVRDQRRKQQFTSRILPPYLRRVPSVDALIPVLYLKGISTGDFTEALAAILGPSAAGLSATNIVRLQEGWQKDYAAWAGRDLRGKRYIYCWADGIYFNVRLDGARPCDLVLMGTLADGTKELITVWDGIRESKESWLEVLRDLKARGLAEASELAVGDGALGFWAALAPTKEKAQAAYRRFLSEFAAKYPQATECLRKDEDVLFTCYDFPAEHWRNIRTTNPIESTFATVRHRTRQTKGCGSRLATLTMVFKLATQAERHWRKLNSSELLMKVVQGATFVDGIMEQAA